MINYRNIFNPNYNYIGIIVITVLIITIFIIKKDNISSIYQISKSSLIAGIITLCIGILLDLLIDILYIGNYKIFIEVITNNITNNIYFYSIAIIIISAILNLIIRTISKSEKIS